MEKITSIKDKRIILARELQAVKGRQKHGKVLLEGEQVIDWALDNRVDIEYILVVDSSAEYAQENMLTRGSRFLLLLLAFKRKLRIGIM